MKDKQLVIRLTEKLHKELKMYSVKSEISMNLLIVEAIQELIKLK